jgi:hypothetical protein
VAVEGSDNKAKLNEVALTSWASVVEDAHSCCRVDNDWDWILQLDMTVPKNRSSLDLEHLDMNDVNDTDLVMVVNTHHFHAEQMPHALLNPYAYVPLQDW